MMKSRKTKPSRKLTAIDVLAALDDVVKPFTSYDATFGKDINGTCFFATQYFHGTGKTFSDAFVDWSTDRMMRERDQQVSNEQFKQIVDYLAVITGVPVRYLLGKGPAKSTKHKAQPARKRR